MIHSHGIMGFYQSGYVSNNEDEQSLDLKKQSSYLHMKMLVAMLVTEPRPKKAKLISPYENVVITTID
ncbi:hypothetical protein H5410_002424 [Solanum commersonii]|uniref:Uncharacterized protein n=1 Tax=Solanum commersonii TaxID=4109 RepID=A0A9J6B293_SOLCO|nr:hypothetical protein H5410_002424 [Solanum commersonii]